ncbi:hypothetical protein OU631_05150, partial [Escherichia coli]|nr:hypothetical protein [Escherichia coli]
PRPDTACGLQAEKTGRFSLHWRDNTRPEKTQQRRIGQSASNNATQNDKLLSPKIPLSPDIQ